MSFNKMRSHQRISADDFDYNTAPFDEQERGLNELKNFQRDFLNKQNNYQKETLERIDKDHQKLDQEIEETHRLQQ